MVPGKSFVSGCLKVFPGAKGVYEAWRSARPVVIGFSAQKKGFSLFSFKGSNENSMGKLPGAISSKYEKFPDKTNSLLLDIELEREKNKVLDKRNLELDLDAINLKRGASGVFEIEELVNILQQEKAEDIFVIQIPPECSYVDYLVVVTGRSTKHMLAISQFIRKIFKKKKSDDDIIPIIEGKHSKNWMALDLGNIALHIFSKSGRELFDLESLWTVGKQHDSQYIDTDEISKTLVHDYSTLLSKLIPDTLKKN